jgi:putative ATP-binding cassette transporter
MADKPNGDTRTRRPDRAGPPGAPPVAPAGPPVAPAEAPSLAVPPEREVPGSPGPLRSGLRDAYALLVDLRGAPRSWIALMLAAGVLLVIIVNMVAQVRLNTWQGDFFNAIERKDLAGVGRQLLIFLPIAGVLLCLVVAQTWMHEMLKVRIRATVTRRLLDVWLSPRRAYRLGVTSAVGVNPDQRMQEDVRHLAELTADLGIGFVHHVLLLGTFVGVLWVLSSGISIPIGGGDSVIIPGYMVWAALLYAGAGSWLAWWIGRPLIGLHVRRYETEAEFRFALVRVSESAEAVALYGGEKDERRYIDKTFANVLTAMRRVVFAVARLTWITSGYGWIAIVVPTVVALPGYFYGGLTLGGLMMVVGAFNQVQQALRWFVDNYARIADWRASLHRVVVFDEALKDLDEIGEESRIELGDHPEGRLAFRNVSVLLSDGRVLIKGANTEIGPGERVLIVGESGSGKSTLFRAIAGLWPWGTGTILLPPRETMMFMPQKPYLPLGTLRTALAYPSAPDAFTTDEMRAALGRVNLEGFAPMLDREERWDRLMSVGEQQRLAFARLLLQKPRWVFLDEATAALDDENQARVMSIFDDELQGAALISIGHRAGLERYHTKTLELAESTGGERLRLRTRQPDRPKSRLFRRLRTLLPGRARKGESVKS